MSELQKISAATLGDVIKVLNESSRGTSFEWNFDLFSFLSLSRYWNFSLEYTLIRYVDNQPAAIVVNCADPEAREAYNFYWGALPKFRSLRIALSLFDSCCDRLNRDGYTLLHGDSAPDRPVRRYRFIQAQPGHKFCDMQAANPDLPGGDPSYQIRPIDPGSLPQATALPGEALHWCQRNNFLIHAAPFFQILGAFSGDSLKAYAVVLTKAQHTTLSDLRSPELCAPACLELLRSVLQQDFRAPLKVTHVFEGGFTYNLLQHAGFSVVKSFSTLVRDLRATCGP
jgi:hypothetical protein